jgi:thiol-disulfide isomerase/thioredoxin
VLGAVVAVSVVLVASVTGLLLRRRNGTFRTAKPTPDRNLEQLGVIPGTPVTLVQFSTAFCAPCRATRVYCADLARTIPGVRHVEVDAESHLDVVRALDIWRTPTVLVVDAEGTVRSRASGATNRARLLAAVAEVLPAVATGRLASSPGQAAA